VPAKSPRTQRLFDITLRYRVDLKSNLALEPARHGVIDDYLSAVGLGKAGKVAKPTGHACGIVDVRAKQRAAAVEPKR
jgi:hypothetical protein